MTRYNKTRHDTLQQKDMTRYNKTRHGTIQQNTTWQDTLKTQTVIYVGWVYELEIILEFIILVYVSLGRSPSRHAVHVLHV